MGKHTAGPWHVAGNLVIEEANATAIAQIAIGDGEANAQLIAAAPLLLKAAKALAINNSSLNDIMPKNPSIGWAALYTAIAAAEGDASE